VNTKFDCNIGNPSMNGDQRAFVGWLDDTTFLGRVDINAFTLPPDLVRIVRVDIHSQTEEMYPGFHAWRRRIQPSRQCPLCFLFPPPLILNDTIIA
jgi:hypothetical protein